MLELFPSALQPFFGVGILALLFLAATSLIHSYRHWQAEKMIKAKRLLRGAARLERALERLHGLSLPRELVVICQQEMLVRYRQVLELFPRDPDAKARIQELEQMPLDNTRADWSLPNITTLAQFNGYTKGMTALVDCFTQERPLGGLTPGNMREIRERLRTLRAAAYANYYTESALNAAKKEDWERAHATMKRLLDLLKAKAPPNEQGRTLYLMARERQSYFLQRQIPPNDAPTNQAA